MVLQGILAMQHYATLIIFFQLKNSFVNVRACTKVQQINTHITALNTTVCNKIHVSKIPYKPNENILCTIIQKKAAWI